MSCISEAFWTATNDSARTRMTARDVVINNDGNMLDPVLQCEWLQDAVNPMRIWPFVGGGEISSGRGRPRVAQGECHIMLVRLLQPSDVGQGGPGWGSQLLRCLSHKAMTNYQSTTVLYVF